MNSIFKTFVTLSLLVPSLASAANCKMKMVNYSDDWMSADTKQLLINKGYELVGPHEQVETDYVLTYHLMTAGIYRCTICTGKPKRFANFDIRKADKAIIELEVGSTKHDFAYLRSELDKKIIKAINKKLKDCR